MDKNFKNILDYYTDNGISVVKCSAEEIDELDYCYVKLLPINNNLADSIEQYRDKYNKIIAEKWVIINNKKKIKFCFKYIK